MVKLRALLLAALSAVLISIATPNELFSYGNPLFGFICLVPLWVAFALVDSRRFAHLLGLLFGIVSSLLTYFWLAFFHGFSVWTIGGVTLGFAYQYFIFGPYLYTFMRTNSRWRPFVFAAAWTVYEWFKSIGYLGFPWGLLAYPVGGLLPLVQIADITGVWGVSFLVASVNGMAAETLMAWLGIDPRPLRAGATTRRRIAWVERGAVESDERRAERRRELARGWSAAGLIAVGFLAYGTVRLLEPVPVKAHLSLLLVQQNSDSWLTGNELPSIANAEELTLRGLMKAPRKPDLIVWSEESFQRPYELFKSYFRSNPPELPFTSFLRIAGVPLLAGTPHVLDLEKQEVENAVLLIDPNGKVVDHYGKRHPVPFAEHIPFWEVPAVRNFMQNVVGVEGIWTLGRRWTLFSVPTSSGGAVRFGAPICFEDSFPSIGRAFFLEGADLLINLTNDSWSRTISAETQHVVAARYRAIEAKRVLVRSSNSGVTAVIGPHGEIEASLPLFKPESLSVDVPVAEERGFTPYLLFGDWAPLALALWLFLLLMVTAGLFDGSASSRKGDEAADGAPHEEPVEASGAARAEHA